MKDTNIVSPVNFLSQVQQRSVLSSQVIKQIIGEFIKNIDIYICTKNIFLFKSSAISCKSRLVILCGSNVDEAYACNAL